MSAFTLAVETIKNGADYMPIGSKEALAKEIADKCVVPLKTAEQNKAGNKILALPCVHGVDHALKAILLQNVLLGFYFGIELDPNVQDVREAYDKYASAHIFEQLSALRNNAEIRDKTIRIYNDYKAFEKFVDVEITNRAEAENDTLARILSAVQIMSSKELTEKLMAELQSAMTELADKKAEISAAQEAATIAGADNAG